MNARTRFLALPLLTAGILAGALGLAGTAAADTAAPSSGIQAAAATAQRPQSEFQAQRHHHHHRHQGE